MNYNEFFLRLLKEAAMPTHPSASETDGLAQRAVAGDDGDLDAVNDSFGMPDDAAYQIDSARQKVRNEFISKLDSTLAMNGDVGAKAKEYESLSKKINKIEMTKTPNADKDTYEILANIMDSDTDFAMKLNEAKTKIKNFLNEKSKLDELRNKLESSDVDNELELEEPPTLPMR
jgi:hypothetical protein